MQPFVGVDGELYSTVPGSGVFTLHADLGLDIFDDVRPCFALVGVACLITGKFSRPVVYYDDIDEFHPAGLEAPTGAPVAASGGPGNVEGEAIYYYTFEPSAIYTMSFWAKTDTGTAPTMNPARSKSPGTYSPGISAVSPPSSAHPFSRHARAIPSTTDAVTSGSSLPVAK